MLFRLFIISSTIIHCCSAEPWLAAAWMPNRQPPIKKVKRNPYHPMLKHLTSNGNRLVHISNLSGRGSGAEKDTDRSGKKPINVISLSLFVSYLTVMGAKCALPSTLSSISSVTGIAHHSETLSRHDVISRLLALSTLSISIGKLALGPVIDSIGGMKSLQIALTTLFVCLGCIGLGPTCPTLTYLAGYWIIIDFAFSSCWAACVKTIRDHMEESSWSRGIGQLAMAARIGNAASFVFFSWLLQIAAIRDNAVASTGLGVVDNGWRWVFRASSLIQLVPLTLLHFAKKRSTLLGDVRKDVSKSENTSALRFTMTKSLLILAREARTREFWLHLITRTIMMVLISFLLFIPTFMNQCYNLSVASATRVGSFFALGCFTSVTTLSSKAYPASSTLVGYKRKSWAMLGLLGLSTAILSLQYFFLLGLIDLSQITGSFLMFLWGFSLSIPFYIPGNMFALKRGGEEGSATIADAFDACGFGLLAIFNSYVAQVLNAAGNRKAAWSPVFLWMLGGSAVSMLSIFFAVSMEGRSNQDLVKKNK